MASPEPDPAPAQQRTAAESSALFRMRMMGFVAELKSTYSFFFYKRVTKSMASQVGQGPSSCSLNFPIQFLRQHRRKFDLDVTFVVNGIERPWPIKLSERSWQSRDRIFAFGAGGWKAFVEDNRVKVGDFVFFNLIRFSEFEVTIGRAPAEEH